MRSVVVALLAAVTPVLLAASADNNVEHNGLSHISWQDRRPLCPIGGEAFDVLFQTYRFDITSARVRVDVGGQTLWVDAAYQYDRGPYAVWGATVPATLESVQYYYIEVTDGSDVDYIGPNGPSETAPASGWEVNFGNLTHAPVGATPTSDGGCVFKVWAPSATTADVRGGFNGWSGTPLTKLGGYFVGYVPNVPADDRDNPGSNYKYVFNGSNWKPDPRARGLHPGDNYNSVVTDPLGYTWASDGYVTPAFEDMIIYQLHIGRFAGRNDPYGATWDPSRYYDVMARADHLAELGVTAVMLCPITEFPWDWSGGYNPITQFAPEAAYGHPHEVKMMVDALHERGIAVLLDVVWNHNSGTDNFMWYYDGTQIYFDDPAVGTPWGDQLDLDRQEVREYFIDSMLYWIEEYRIDGFRFDATAFISPYQSGGWSLMQWANNEMDRRAAHKIMIAEQLPSDWWITASTAGGGAGFDAQYHMQFRDALRAAVLDAAYGTTNMWAVRDAIYSTDIGLLPGQRLNYVELHDEAWPESGGQRLVKTIDPEWPHDSEYAKGRTKAAFGLTLVSPGIPAILMGTEWLEDTDFGAGGPGNPEARINWALRDVHAGIFEFYKDLIGIRKTNGALRANAGYEVYHVNDQNDVLAMQRWTGDGNLLVIIVSLSNTTINNYHVGMPAEGTWYELINSQAPGYEGFGGCNPGAIQTSWDDKDGFAQSAYLTVPGMSIIVLRHEDGQNDFLDADFDRYIDACDNCPDVANADQADSNGDGVGDACDCNGNGVYDSTDIASGTSQDTNGNGIPDECESGWDPGDMNCDGTVDVFDINPFVAAVLDPAQYATDFPGCDIDNGDINGDDVVDVFDINPFVNLILGS